jgi:PIN domain nuclease of toxin-antitoxin system
VPDHDRVAILDTHVWLWLMEGDPRLAGSLSDSLEEAAAAGKLCVTTLSLWEVAALEALHRVQLRVPVGVWLDDALSTPGLSLIEIDPVIAAESVRLPGTFAGDPVDRLIVAAARLRAGRVYTADPDIIAYGAAGYVDVAQVAG